MIQSDRKPKHGGARPGAGKKPITPGDPLTEKLTIKVTPAQKQRYLSKGGAQWVRDEIDK